MIVPSACSATLKPSKSFPVETNVFGCPVCETGAVACDPDGVGNAAFAFVSVAGVVLDRAPNAAAMDIIMLRGLAIFPPKCRLMELWNSTQPNAS